jgi:hypothetical protein
MSHSLRSLSLSPLSCPLNAIPLPPLRAQPHLSSSVTSVPPMVLTTTSLPKTQPSLSCGANSSALSSGKFYSPSTITPAILFSTSLIIPTLHPSCAGSPMTFTTKRHTFYSSLFKTRMTMRTEITSSLRCAFESRTASSYSSATSVDSRTTTSRLYVTSVRALKHVKKTHVGSSVRPVLCPKPVSCTNPLRYF